ncbi:MAG: hypothetical protein M1319_00995 [Chloroflexi bacterium]|nr:hypothetical protein [Chloroflexota bacterium]
MIAETVAPSVAEAYERDRRARDLLCDSRQKAMDSGDQLVTARVTAALNTHMRIRLDKEDAHLYRIFNERVSLLDQGVVLGKMAQKIPPERFPEVVSWLYPLIGPDDQENMTRIWRQSLPEPVFAGLLSRIQLATGGGWAELVRRIPEIHDQGSTKHGGSVRPQCNDATDEDSSPILLPFHLLKRWKCVDRPEMSIPVSPQGRRWV